MLNAAKVKQPARKFEGKKYEDLPSGTYEARLVRIIDLGLRPQDDYMGEKRAPSHQVKFIYELLEEFLPHEETGEPDEDNPRWVSETINFLPLYLSDGKFNELAKTTKRYKVFDPDIEDGGDWAAQLGKPCLVQLKLETWTVKGTEEKASKNVIKNITEMPAKLANIANPIRHPEKSFAFDMDDPDMDVYWGQFGSWMRRFLTEGLDFSGSVLEQAIKDNPQPGEGEEEVKEKAPPKKKPAAKKSKADEAKEIEEDWEEELDDEVPF